MALTITQQPQLYTPAYNSQVIVALSTQIAQPNFKYVVTVQVNGGAILTDNILQRPDGYLVYDPIEKVKNYIDRSYFTPLINTVSTATNKAVSVQVTVKEFYSNALQATTIINYIAFDACLTDSDFRNYNYLDYYGAGLSISLLSPEIYEPFSVDNRVTINTDVFIHFFRKNATNIIANIYDATSTFVGTVNKTIPATNNLIYYTNIGSSFFNGSAFTLANGYTVEIEIVNGVTSLYNTAYTIKPICSKHKKNIVYYLKRNGNIGYFHFELLSKETESKKSNTVRLNPKKLTAGVYGANSWEREKNIVSTELTKKIVLNTNWITEVQCTQLEELFSSPIVWIKDELNNYLPVTITDTSYEFDKHVNTKLFNLVINCEYTSQETTQRGL
jgi:hypothetical protein